jgi:hypothetical protein
MRPKPTWHGFVRWTRLGFIGGPVFCILAAVLLIVDVKDVAGWVFAAIAVVGIFQTPSRIGRYRHARLHELAGDPDPPDLRTLLGILKSETGRGARRS